MSRRFLLPTALSFVLVGIAPARSASFDCAKAQAPDERAICANRNLSERDVEMSALWFSYSRIPLLMGANADRRDGQAAFLRARTACGGDLSCLEKLYAARIATLKTDITSALKAVPPS